MPKRDDVRRIDLPLRTGIGSALTDGYFNDSHLLHRDGTRSLLGYARWLWEAGAEVAGTLRALGSGLLQIIGRLFVGHIAGPRVSLGRHLNDEGRYTFVLEAVDSENVPFFSVGAHEQGAPDAIWLNLGREGLPRIQMGHLAGYERAVPLVDARLLVNTIPARCISLSGVAIPIVDKLDDLHFTEGQLFLLRLGVDSGALYVWTRWGPEAIGGYHRSGLHDHHDDTEGGRLRLDQALADVHLTDPTAHDLLVYRAGAWRNLAATEVIGTINLTQLGDVELTSPQAGDWLAYDAIQARWCNRPWRLPRTEQELITDYGPRLPTLSGE